MLLMVENAGQLPKACILYAGSSTKRNSTAQVAVLDRLVTILINEYRLEAELKGGVGRCWATERAVTIYKKGLYVNIPKDIREKLPVTITFTVK